MTQENGKNTMEFVLPSKYSKENAAMPNDKTIEVYNSKPGYYAAIQFGGYSNSEKINKHYKLLVEEIKKNKLSIIDKRPIALSYNSPYKVFNRRNEVLVEISATQD
jgi:effector-binding domain-containing protein